MFQNTAFNRWFFIIVSIIILTLVFVNTYSFFNQLKENERSKMEIWASALEVFESTDLQQNASGANLLLVQKIISSNKTTPMLSYSYRDSIYTDKNIDSTAINTLEKKLTLIEKFKSEYTPIDIKYKNELRQTIYYGNSPLINKLKYYPALLLVIIGLFFSTVYYIYKTSRSAEQNQLWAGMAKETAHQIGTPLSSLIGWIEILKTENVDPGYIKEMAIDVNRLETIADRFSKVGSIPDLKRLDIITETKESFDYLKSRNSKLITFQLELPEQEKVMVNINKQLYSWTIENLVKNGIDAMKGKGLITLTLIAKPKTFHIHITDSGKGIVKKNHKQIFKPGFTTKKRGWGLGLSLARRIIEEYHGGKIRVLKSIIEEGTTMEIILKRDA